MTPLSFEEDRKWWEQRHGAKAYAAWCNTAWRMLTRKQQHALRHPLDAHTSTLRKLAQIRLLRRSALADCYELTPLGRDVVRHATENRSSTT